MWYIKLNGKILPTPYLYRDDCMEELYRIKEEMGAVLLEAVYI
jgi:hypothetical protein